MARVALVIEKTELSEIIQKVESENNGPFPNRSALAQAVAETDWAQNVKDAKDRVKGASSAVIQARIRELGIEPQTPVGKRGRPAGVPMPAGAHTNRTSRSEKFQAPKIAKYFSNLKKAQPDERTKNLAERAAKGSMAAAVKLKCIECVGYEDVSKRVGQCGVKTCSLWAFRPYQKATIERETVASAESDEDKTEANHLQLLP